MKIFLRRAAIALLICIALLTLAVLCRTPILTWAAETWIVSEPVTKADAIVVLGGGLQTRPFEAARLYRAGIAPRVLLMNVKPTPTTESGITPTEQDLTTKLLLQQGVPRSDLVVVGNGVASTREESIAVRDWVKQTRAKRVIITTDLFHTHRVRWLFRKALDGTGAQPVVVAVPQREYSARDWWTHEEGLIAFQNEIIKYLFYRLRY